MSPPIIEQTSIELVLLRREWSLPHAEIPSSAERSSPKYSLAGRGLSPDESTVLSMGFGPEVPEHRLTDSRLRRAQSAQHVT
jgi:hypothetical protein